MAASEQEPLQRRSGSCRRGESVAGGRTGGIPALPTAACGAKGEIDVLVVGEVRRVEHSDGAQNLATDEGGASGHGGHRTVVAPDLPAGHSKVAVAGTAERVDLHAGRIDPLFAAKQKRAAKQACLAVRGRRLEQRLEPPGLDLDVVIDERGEVGAGGESASQ